MRCVEWLLLLSHFSRVRLCVTPWTAAHQAPPSLGFSRQEHWSGLPFPSPMHENEKWKWSCSVASDSLATPWTAAHQAPPYMGFSRQEYWSGVPLPSPSFLYSAYHFDILSFRYFLLHVFFPKNISSMFCSYNGGTESFGKLLTRYTASTAAWITTAGVTGGIIKTEVWS